MQRQFRLRAAKHAAFQRGTFLHALEPYAFVAVSRALGRRCTDHQKRFVERGPNVIEIIGVSVRRHSFRSGTGIDHTSHDAPVVIVVDLFQRHARREPFSFADRLQRVENDFGMLARMWRKRGRHELLEFSPVLGAGIGLELLIADR